MMDTKKEQRVLRQLVRQQRARHPAFARRLRRLTDDELAALAAALLEAEITRLRLLPSFSRNLGAQDQVASHEYALRLNRERAAWRSYYAEPPKVARRPLPDRLLGLPARATPLAAPDPTPLALNWPAAPAEPSTPEPVAAEPEPVTAPADNVVPFPRCHAKAWHGGRELGPGYSGQQPDNEVW